MVIGCGAVGLSAVQGARISGASIIVGVDINPLKLEWAEKFGATHVVNSAETDPVEFVQDLTQGRGADTAIEAAGQNISIRQTLEVITPRRTSCHSWKNPVWGRGLISVPSHDGRARNRAYLLRNESSTR